MYLAVIAKVGAASRALTQEPGATGATSSQNDEIAIGCRTPTGIRISSQNSA